MNPSRSLTPVPLRQLADALRSLRHARARRLGVPVSERCIPLERPTAVDSLSAMHAAVASMEACRTGGEGAMNDDKSLNALVVTIPKGARP